MRALVIIALAACGGIRPARMIAGVERPAVTLPLAAPIAFGPVAHPAARYNAAAGAASTPLRDAVFAALRDLAHERGDPRRDARLDLAAGDLAELVSRGGAPIEPVVELALHERGVIEAANKVLVARATAPEAIVAELREALGDSLFFGNVRVGVGGGEGQPVVVLVTHAALVALEPIPRALPAHGEIELHATLDPTLHDPRVTVAHDDAPDAPEHPAIWKTDRYAFTATVACGDHAGTAWVLIEAADELAAVQRLALFPLACGDPPDGRFRIEARAPVPDGEIARRLTAIINRERAAAGLSILRGDLRADAAAHREVLLMARSHSVAHALGSTTSITRLRDANLIPPWALEATLHAPDVASAAEILMNERGYREILARPEITHLGVAIAFDEHHELYVAIELVQIVETIDTDRLAAQILARINAPRDRLDQLVPDKVLSQLAAKYTRLRARGWTDASAMLALKDDGNFVFGRFIALRRALSLLLDGDLAKVDFGPPGKTDGVGISVAQSPREGALTGRVWVIILYGVAR